LAYSGSTGASWGQAAVDSANLKNTYNKQKIDFNLEPDAMHLLDSDLRS
jgi:hypothetical protein